MSTIWIKHHNEATEAFKVPPMEQEAVLSENNTAQLPDDVGEQLVEQYDYLSKYETEATTEA